jgi:glycosyltransferase involved in cell wall biosynthesis
MMNDSYPSISIVVIGLNEADNLPNTFNAILNMNYPQDKLDLIYVDSGSTDNSVEIAKNYSYRVFVEPNYPSSGRNRNRGLLEARYEIVHFLDGDVEIDQDYFKNIVSLFEEKNAQAIVGQLEAQRPSLLYRFAQMSNISKKEGYINSTSTGGTYLRTPLLMVNGYDERIRRGQEVELGERFRKEGFKIWCTKSKLGCHNFAIKSVSELLEKDYSRGYHYAVVARLDGDGEYFRVCRAVIRKQLIFFPLIIIIALALIATGYMSIAILLIFLSSINNNKSIIKRKSYSRVSDLIVKVLIGTISQFYYFRGICRLQLAIRTDDKIKKFSLLRKETLRID